jgi:putative protein kinase ArgK-like GTPase of G3E family
MESAGLFVINKSERPGADALQRELHALLSLSADRDSRQSAPSADAETGSAAVPGCGPRGFSRWAENVAAHRRDLCAIVEEWLERAWEQTR